MNGCTVERGHANHNWSIAAATQMCEAVICEYMEEDRKRREVRKSYQIQEERREKDLEGG